MKKRLLTLAAGLLSAAALTGSAGTAHAYNCYFMPIVLDCYDIAVDCECIDIIVPPNPRAERPSPVVETSTLRHSIGW